MIKGIRPSIAQAGAIKIGRLDEKERIAKSGRKWRAPVKLDHFLVVRNTRDANGNFEVDTDIMNALVERYADSDGQCRAIPIVLHSDDIDDVFPTAYAAYGGKQLVCRGDGDRATFWRYKNKVRLGTTAEKPCPCEWLERDQNGMQRCKPQGVLHCSIALPGYAVAGAVYRWRTTGMISIQRMIGSLQQILAIVGTLQHIPLMLRVQPVTVSPDGKTTIVYSCHIELHAADVMALQRQALEARAARERFAPAATVKQLVRPPASDDETPEEQADVAEEFYPPAAETDIMPEDPKEAVRQAAKRTAAKTPEKPPAICDCGPDVVRPDGAVACHKCGRPYEEIGKLQTFAGAAPIDDAPDYGSPDDVEKSKE